jgi:hypothetical protein
MTFNRGTTAMAAKQTPSVRPNDVRANHLMKVVLPAILVPTTSANTPGYGVGTGAASSGWSHRQVDHLLGRNSRQAKGIS